MEIVLAILGVGVIVLVLFFVLRSRSEAKESAAPIPVAAKPPPTKLWLLGIEGGVEGKAFRVANRMMTIGRAPTNVIQVEDDDVSRVHTRVEPKDGYLQITDLKSYNGTHVEGERVKEARLTVGQTLRVGGATFRVEMDVDAPDAARTDKTVDGHSFMPTLADAGDIVATLKATLKETGGDIEEAARRLGADPETLRHLAKAQGIQLS